MPVDYKQIRQFNKGRYGWDIKRIGQQIFADTYADPTHFIFELLQNAEDAIARRGPDWDGSRTVSFDLTKNLLRVSHFGEPFNEDDVRGICGIAESTKELTDIGRFGIGFKSVYAFTDRPRIHSGDEDFAIESFVWPTAVLPIVRDPCETVILMPLKSRDPSDHDEIASGLRSLGIQTLLFLRQVEKVKWSIHDVDSGQYLRKEVTIDDTATRGVRRVTVTGQAAEKIEVDEKDWLIFSRQVTESGVNAGFVETAFSLDVSDDGHEVVSPVPESPLVVFFPTVLETRLGFLLQGPYQTTPSRDNIPQFKPWNLHLVSESAILLKAALRWLRDHDRLDTNVLRCLPAGSANFNMGMFEPLYRATRECLSSEPLLPREGGGFISAQNAVLGRSLALRRLLSDKQLKALYPSKSNPSWLTSDVTADRTPGLRNYFIHDLKIEEPTPAMIIRRCTATFFEDQSDEWIQNLYEFLNDHRGLLKPRFPYLEYHQLHDVALLRLEDGRHTTAESNGEIRAFLPNDTDTEFPTVRPATCGTTEARAFLDALGLREPDPIDDVIENVLPRYADRGAEVTAEQYESDINRVLNAYTGSDSFGRRRMLVGHLRTTPFVMATDIGSGLKCRAEPHELYMRTEQLLSLFSGVDRVLFVDGDFKCLASDGILDLLRKCGASSHLRPVKVTLGLKPWPRTIKEYPEIKREYSTRDERIEDFKLLGLDLLLATLPRLRDDQWAPRAKLLWQALTDLATVEEESFSGSYHWFYRRARSASLNSHFVKLLNQAEWISNSEGDLCKAGSIYFEDLGWQENTFLLSKITFRPPSIGREAAQALSSVGISADVLNELRRLPSTRISELLRDALKREAKRGDRKSRHHEDDSSLNEGQIDNSSDQTVDTFVDHMTDSMTPVPSYAPASPVSLPIEGTKTAKSAVDDTQRSARSGRSGRHMDLRSRTFVLSDEGKGISDKIKAMLYGDYGKRCQICGVSFRTRGGELQTFASHPVAPAKDLRTNHFGNLLSLCGWHYALVRYGEWVFLDPTTRVPTESGSDLRTLLMSASEEIDLEGNSYTPVPIRFWNVYCDWRSDPENIDEEIRLSGPHRRYLLRLLET